MCDIWQRNNNRSKKEVFPCVQHILLGAQPRVVTSSVRYLELCLSIPYAQGVLAFQWAIGNANSKEILNSQSGKQLALGGSAPERQALEAFVHVLLAVKAGAQNLVEQEAFSICPSLASLRQPPQELYSPPPLLRLQAEVAQMKTSSVGQHQVLDPVSTTPSTSRLKNKQWLSWRSLFSISQWSHWNGRMRTLSPTILILEKLTRPSSVKFGVPSSINARSVRYIPR